MMVLAVIAAVLLAWALTSVALALWAGQPPEADERHPVHTEDGWLLTLHRYLPAEGVPRQPIPLVLGHGIVMNRTCWELSPRSSLPRALAARGHDVFVAEYRGQRSSRPPQRGERAGRRWDYDIDDHVRYDLPAIIDAACRLADAERISWVGHSMGGIVLYLYAARSGSDRLHRAVALGSPVHFGPWRGLHPALLRTATWLNRRLPHLPIKFGALAGLPFCALAPRIALRFCLNARHASTREAVRLAWTALEDVSSGVTGAFLGWISERQDLCPGDDEELDGPDRGGLRRLDVPLLVLGGREDLLASRRAVEPAFHRAGSQQAGFRLFGDTRAEDPDPGPPFGHSDMVSSELCLEQVAPVVAEWLEGDAPRLDRARLRRGV